MNIALPAIAAVVIVILLLPKIRQAEFWRAAVTPLASIIGSGFLIVAPLLGYSVGAWAPVAMAGIVLAGYAVGGVIRFNIRHLEPLLRDGDATLLAIERCANAALGVAYVISVAFYVRLLASFLLHPLGPGLPAAAGDLVSTIILSTIGLIGIRHGLRGLEWLEESAVAIKLGIIAALLAGLSFADVGWLSGQAEFRVHAIDDGPHALRLLAGMLLVVQGFETSRYLAASYPAELRIRSMRTAQWLTAGIYVVFVCLALPMLGPYEAPPAETAIIDTSRQLAWILPPMLIVAALMSQLSAAVADTAGSGGLFAEASGGRIPRRSGYVAVTAVAILLVWLTDVFELVAIASRAFALYYLVQCIAAWFAARGIADRRRRTRLRAGFTALACGLTAVVVFAIPAESA